MEGSQIGVLSKDRAEGGAPTLGRFPRGSGSAVTDASPTADHDGDLSAFLHSGEGRILSPVSPKSNLGTICLSGRLSTVVHDPPLPFPPRDPLLKRPPHPGSLPRIPSNSVVKPWSRKSSYWRRPLRGAVLGSCSTDRFRLLVVGNLPVSLHVWTCPVG